MALVSDDFHSKKLKEYGINIKTKYFVGNKIYERNTDNSINDDINSGIRCEKEYYKNNKLIHKEKEFDSRIEYTFISKDLEEKEYRCPNCGMTSKLKDFEEGCPYCRTIYNIEYTDKDLGSKYHYDRVLRNNTYRIITAIIDLIISIIISYLFIISTSRTFNNIDVIKIFVYGIILSIVLYYFFYILDAYVVLGPIKRYKDKQNEKQINFWNRTKIEKKNFFNNLNFEIRKKYYSKKNIIDFDIIDYLKFEDRQKGDNFYVIVTADVRVVYYLNGKIKPKFIKEEYVLRKNPNESLKLEDGANMIKCHNCGASIDATSGECSYCHSASKYYQEWFME